MSKASRSKESMALLKWMGGKTSLLEPIGSLIQQTEFRRYVDLFAGSMAIPLALGAADPRFQGMVINDINPVLIEVYKEIQRDPTELLVNLGELDKPEYNDKEIFGELRTKYNETKSLPYTTQLGALFIYLNRRCFNGMYRENQSGGFNTPYRAYKSGIYSPETIAKLHVFFRTMRVEFHHVSYKELLSGLREGDLVYMDPPYYPCSTNCFTQYHASGFSVQDQVELMEFVKELTKRGIKFIQSNAPCQQIKDLYKGFTIRELNVARRMRSAKLGSEPKVEEDEPESNECLIMNF